MSVNSITVHWNAHYTALLQLLKSARTEGLYCDATLFCNGMFYSVHRFVLAACSTYFKEMFDKINGKNPMIIMMNMKATRLEALLSYMYDGEVNIMQEELAGFMETAETWKIKGLSSSTTEEYQDVQRRVQSSPSIHEAHRPSQMRIARNFDWQKANVLSSDIYEEVVCNQRIPSIVPGSAVSLSGTVGNCGSVTEERNNGNIDSGRVLDNTMQLEEESMRIQEREDTSCCGDSANQNLVCNHRIPSIVSGSAISLSGTVGNCGSVTDERNNGNIDSGRVLDNTMQLEEERMRIQGREDTPCYSDSANWDMMVIELKAEPEGMDHHTSFQNDSFLNSSLRSGLETQEIQHEIGEACIVNNYIVRDPINLEEGVTQTVTFEGKVTEAEKVEDVAGCISPRLTRNNSSKKRRNIQPPKRFYSPEIVRVKKNCTIRKKSNSETKQDEKKTGPPKRKVGRPRKHPLPESDSDYISSPLRLDFTHNPNDVLSSSISGKNAYKETSQVSEQLSGDVTSKLVSNVKRSSASKGRISLLRQFGKNISLDSKANVPISKKNSNSLANNRPKKSWMTRKKGRVSKAKRWSRQKRESLLAKVSGRGSSQNSQKKTVFRTEKSGQREVLSPTQFSSLKVLNVRLERLSNKQV